MLPFEHHRRRIFEQTKVFGNLIPYQWLLIAFVHPVAMFQTRQCLTSLTIGRKEGTFKIVAWRGETPTPMPRDTDVSVR